MDIAKRTWVFIRGLGHEREHWGTFTEEFQERFPEDRIIHIDMLGTGVHHVNPPPLSIHGILQQARQDAQQQANGPYHILSISMGSMLADAWAREAPDEVCGVVLINTSFASFSAPYERMHWRIWPHFLQALSTRKPSRREERFLRIITAKDDIHSDHIKHRVNIRSRRPVRGLNFVRQLIAASLYQGSPTPPPVPTLILSSQGDKLCDPSCSAEIAQSWGCPSAEHSWAGHDLTYDDPAWVIEQVEQWLTKHCSSEQRVCP